MSRDRWFAVSLVAALLACLPCLAPFALTALGAIGLSAGIGPLDIAVLCGLAVVLGIAIYRYRAACRRAQ